MVLVLNQARHPAWRVVPTRGLVWLCLGFALALGLAAPQPAQAARYCDEPPALSADQHDKLLRFAGIIKQVLDESGAPGALMARSGLDLTRFEHRYSHAGLSLRDGALSPWQVRQLYYACEEQRPRIFDQGLSAFLLGLESPDEGFISVILLPDAAAQSLVQAAQDKPLALALLGTQYSANAHAYSLLYQNCNQWLVELMAVAWGAIQPEAVPSTPQALRQQAQAWLAAQAYEPSRMQLAFKPLMWLGRMLPWLHTDDHPAQDLDAGLFRVSMPASIEAFVRSQMRTQVLGAQRLEFCRKGAKVLLRRGWQAWDDACTAGPQDEVFSLD